MCEMEIDELLADLEEQRHVYCYGTGTFGRVCAAYLLQNQISMNGFVVSKAEGTSRVMGKGVFVLEDLQDEDEDAFFVVSVAAKHRKAIEENLRRNGKTNYYFLTEEMIHYMRQNNRYDLPGNCRRNINVLMYHRVNLLPNYAYPLGIPPEEFERELKYLKEHYAVISSEDDWTQAEENSVVLTFDDGYADFHQYVLPLLHKYEVPATIFVSTAHIENGDEFFWDILERILFQTSLHHVHARGREYSLDSEHAKREMCFQIRNMLLNMSYEERRKFLHSLADDMRVDISSRAAYRSMNKGELSELGASPYVTIGGHTVTHSALSRQAAEMQKWEIEDSKAYLEHIIGREITVFSYPFGDFDDLAVSVVQECGYQKAFTVQRGLVDGRTDRYRLPRNSIVGVGEIGFPHLLDECWSLYQ